MIWMFNINNFEAKVKKLKKAEGQSNGKSQMTVSERHGQGSGIKQEACVSHKTGLRRGRAMHFQDSHADT